MAKTPNYNWTTYEDGVTVINFQTDISDFIKDVDTKFKQQADSIAANAANIGLLTENLMKAQVQTGFNANISGQRFRVVSVYNGVNTPQQGIGVLMYLPYSDDWAKQIYWDLQNDSTWERVFQGGTTWSAWVVK